MSPPTDPQIVMDSLRRIVQALRQSATHSEQATGLTAAQLLVLKRIQAHEGLSVNELAAATFTHQSTVSEIVTRLETRGLIRRARAATDGRRVELYLTEAGQAVLTASPVSAHEKLMQAVATLPPPTLEKLAGGLNALIEAAHLNEHPARFFFEDKSTPDE
ncbi:MarR family winged helix-turn-helix transcriptional regulator [Asticcacaulis taihuensis]|uniref:MarR family winged helix-turn-helix transcriptional regulator n=1 Tax=Asticcacaulis taihuensis TaxID=260084 RepID=UPI003F7CD069